MWCASRCNGASIALKSGEHRVRTWCSPLFYEEKTAFYILNLIVLSLLRHNYHCDEKPMKYSIPEELMQPSEKTLSFIRQFARNYKVIQLANGEYIDIVLG